MSYQEHMMSSRTATAIACANIAFIKYWGNRDEKLRLPANGSISMNLANVYTRTTVSWEEEQDNDTLSLNGEEISGPALERVSAFLDLVRQMSGLQAKARVMSENNFPVGAGLASSASAFAALALASTHAAGLSLSQNELSRLARRGSGSACRSIPEGFVEWLAGTNDADSYATSIAPPQHWALVDLIAIIHHGHKEVGSSLGHLLASTSPLQEARLADAPRRLAICRQAIVERDFEALATITELDSDLMHAVMMTSSPPLLYWQPVTLAVIQAVRAARQQGLPLCYTIDAGPNVHVLCEAPYADQGITLLQNIQGVQQVLCAQPGGAARLLPNGL